MHINEINLVTYFFFHLRLLKKKIVSKRYICICDQINIFLTYNYFFHINHYNIGHPIISDRLETINF